MRGCERGAGSADRAPAHRSREAIPRNCGEAITGNCGEAIPTHSGEAISNNSGETIPRNSRKAISSNSGEVIQRNSRKAISSNSGEAIQRNSRKAISSNSGEAIQRNSGEAITRNSRKVIPRNITEAIPRNSGEAILRNSGEAILPRRTRGGAILLCVLLLLSLRGSSGSASLGAQLVCARAPLTEKQRALCRGSPAAMAAIATGLRMAYAECRSQLSGRRWNCSGVGDGAHFSHVMPLATREAAYTYAITSAGVTHALSAACARGELPACGCAHRRRVVPGEQWEWSGGGAARCGEAAYGARLARRFLDARELERDARAVMNLHNNRLGRKMVKELVRRECKCHGVSGSCAVRTCWRALPPFRALAAALTDKYQRARMVSPVERGTTDDGRVNIQLVVKRARGGGGRAARKNELVFLEASPSYCEPDAAAGSFGTHGRSCNNTSRGEEGCESLCCGRGYSTVRRAERVQCRCSFQWCCRVRCDSCLTRTELHVCN